MRGLTGLCITLILTLTAWLPARAGVLEAPAADLEVSLITYGPGAIYWERFGHDAIRLHDRDSGESVDFNFGVFDFQDSDFLSNFIRGDMQYMLDIEHSESAQQDYIDAGRRVQEQRLALSADQAASLRALLIWSLRPENVTYDYDYLTNNCATRIRDALDAVLGGAVKKALLGRAAPMTYRQQIDRLMSAQPWLMLAMDFGLGPEADRPLDEWQESFVPMVLARELQHVPIRDASGQERPLLASSHDISPERLTPPPTAPPAIEVPLALAGLFLATLILICRSRLPRMHRGIVAAFLTTSGVLGSALLGLWTLTAHHAAWGNANLLLFNPMAFVIVITAARARGPRWKWARVLTALQLAAAVLAILLYSFPGLTPLQKNLPWILFATPVWLAVTYGIFRRPTLEAG